MTLPIEPHPYLGPTHVVDAITATVTRYVGLNYAVRDMVAIATGDDLAGPFSTAGWVDEDQRCIAFVLHHAWPGGRAEMSIASTGLPLSRAILTFLDEVAFTYGRATEILTRVPVADLAWRNSLRRMGFVISGREHRPDGERLLMVLRPSTFPPLYARARARRRH